MRKTKRRPALSQITKRVEAGLSTIKIRPLCSLNLNSADALHLSAIKEAGEIAKHIEGTVIMVTSDTFTKGIRNLSDPFSLYAFPYFLKS